MSVLREVGVLIVTHWRAVLVYWIVCVIGGGLLILCDCKCEEGAMCKDCWKDS